MTKPVIVTRAVKGAPLTRNELDANFTNIDNATWSVTDGTNTKAFNLNDTLTFTAGTNISLAVNASTGALTINNSMSAFNPASPGAIGGTTPAAITGTTITANTGFSGPHNGTVGAITPAAITGTTITANTGFSGPHNGTVGATTPNTGAFTTLSASSTVSGTGFSTYLASPPAIGGTTAASGKFTTLTATGTTTLATSLTGLVKAASGVISTATAGTDYVAPGGALGTPSSGTVTNLTGTASININGTVGATTPTTGAFTTLSATGAYTGTVTTTGNGINITYNPSTATGAAIQATGKDSQGGTGYFDFFKATNTTTGVTNGSKSIRLSSTGDLQIINSGYTSTILSLTDAGAFTVGGTTLPTSTGTSGQVLTANGSGGSSWASAGGTNQIVLYTSGNAAIALPYTTSTHTVSTTKWTIATSGGVSGVSVSGTNGTITLPAGTYLFELPAVLTGSSSSVGDPELWDYTNNRSVFMLSNGQIIVMGGTSTYSWLGGYATTVVFTGSTNIGFALQSGAGTGTYSLRASGFNQISSVGTNATLATFVLKITKIA